MVCLTPLDQSLIIFGLPGDGINGIMEPLRTRQDRIRFIPARHEESAVFMACASPDGRQSSARHIDLMDEE